MAIIINKVFYFFASSMIGVGIGVADAVGGNCWCSVGSVKLLVTVKAL